MSDGFWELNDGAWRWTKSRFTVVLGPPPGADTQGARLELSFYLPPAIPEKLGPVRVRAEVNGLPLSPAVYAEQGKHTYAREVPAMALADGGALVEFTTDKAQRSTPEGDERELALVVYRIALLPK